MEGAIPSPAHPVLGTLSRLAAALSDPLATFERANWALGDFSPSEIEVIAADATFSRPLRRAIAQHLGAGLSTLSGDDFIRIASAPEGRLAISMLNAPVAEIIDLALLCAGAAFQRDILGATSKADRVALRESLGTSAYLLATQEASGLYPALAPLGDTKRFQGALAEDDSETRRQRFAGYGLGLLFALISPIAPALCDLIARRLPQGFLAGPAPSAKPGDFTRLLRLIDRRKPSWLATIG